MTIMRSAALALFATGVMLVGSIGTAQSQDWWPVEVFDLGDMTSGDFDALETLPETVDYIPLEKASQKWHICVLFPHMKDSYWVSVNYAVIDEARRQGIKATLFSAGGYTELNKQISQFDDCMALNSDAIVIAVISEGGMKAKIAEAREKGIKVIAIINPVFDIEVDAQSHGTVKIICGVAAQHLVDILKDRDSAKIVSLPGPAGSGWAEKCQKLGLERVIKGTNIELLEAKFGDTGKSVQLKLVEDALQTYDEIDAIFGTGVTAEAAVGALEEAGRQNVEVMAWYTNLGVVDLILKGDIAGGVTMYEIIMSRVGVDQAVRILEGKPYMKTVFTNAKVLTKDNFDSVPSHILLAPEDWDPVFSVE
jgi:protein TorT